MTRAAFALCAVLVFARPASAAPYTCPESNYDVDLAVVFGNGMFTDADQAEAEADAGPALPVGEAEGGEHVAGPAGPAGAGRAGGESNLADFGDQAGGIGPFGTDVEIAVVAPVGGAVERPIGAENVPGRRPEPFDMGMVLLRAFGEQPRRLAQSDAKRGRQGARTDAARAVYSPLSPQSQLRGRSLPVNARTATALEAPRFTRLAVSRLELPLVT